MVFGNPDYSTVTVEMVELVGEPPYSEATVTACLVNNRNESTQLGIRSTTERWLRSVIGRRPNSPRTAGCRRPT